MSNTSLAEYMPSCEEINYYAKLGIDTLKNQADARILKKGAIERALEKDGRFKPVQYSPVEGFNDIEVPTVWVKVKKYI